MPDYIVIQTDAMPAAGGPPAISAVYQVNALIAILAADAVALARKATDPVIFQVALAAAFGRYTTTATLTYLSVLG